MDQIRLNKVHCIKNCDCKTLGIYLFQTGCLSTDFIKSTLGFKEPEKIIEKLIQCGVPVEFCPIKKAFFLQGSDWEKSKIPFTQLMSNQLPSVSQV